MESKTATFGAGCFWGVEETFRQLPGVTETAVGYCGGSQELPSYQDVCTGTTGHAEVVQLSYDPEQITYEELLRVFFANHNPTTVNRQGPDVGTQYRSAIFFHDVDQELAARKAIEDQTAAQNFPAPIVTQVEAAATFWRAEEYHQQYLAKRGQSNCQI